MKHKSSLFFVVILIVSLLVYFYPNFFFSIFFAYFFYLSFLPLRSSFLRGSLIKRFFLICFIVFLPVFFIYNLLQFLLLLQEKIPIMTQRIPYLEKTITDYYQQLELRWPLLATFSFDIKSTDFISKYITQLGAYFLQYIPSLLMSLMNFLILIPLFLFFFFRDASLIRKEFYKFIPNYFFEKTTYFIHFFHQNFGLYMFSRFLEGFVVFILLYIGCFIFNIPQGFFLSFFPSILVFIPYVGSVLGYFPGPLLYIFDLITFPELKYYTIVYIIMQIIDPFIIFPLLVSRMIKMHPLLIFFSLFLGAQVLGMLGMMISIPIAAFAKLLYEHLHRDLYEK